MAAIELRIVLLYELINNFEKSVPVSQKTNCFFITEILMNAVWANNRFRRVCRVVKSDC